ncbi:DMT family transporter [Myxococcus sp. K15C18031901]|uniref:DMT family transporter n=1 Tax=Myxococcus dinghuensis TaxID=2906761 RepID=UPI0020A74E49|nr:EamA family transporter [Myxococcus dinghuensis]MCP3098486.1 DMT family transporter [Myxococcus dinghuensis]
MTDETSRRPFLSPPLSLALAMGLLGTVGAFVTETGLDPVTVVFWRCAFGSLFLGAWCLIRGYLPDRSLSWRSMVMAVTVGVCIVMNWIAFFASFGMTTIATTTIVYHIQPFFVVLLGVVFLGERASPVQIAFIVGAFIGVILASGAVRHSSTGGPQWFLGIALTLLAALLYAVSTILAKQLGRLRPEVMALFQTLTGAILLAPFSNHSVPSSSWGWLTGIGVLHTGIAYVLMYAAYPRLGTPAIASLTFIYPLVAILIDWSLYDHPLSMIQGMGLLLIAGCTIGFKLWKPWVYEIANEVTPTRR